MKTYRYKVLVPVYFRHQRYDPAKIGQDIIEIQADEEHPAPRCFLPLDGGPVDEVTPLGVKTLAVIKRKTEQYHAGRVAAGYEPATYSEMQTQNKTQIPQGSEKAVESSKKFKKVVRKGSSSPSDNAGLGD